MEAEREKRHGGKGSLSKLIQSRAFQCRFIESYRLFRATMALSAPSWRKTCLRFLTLAKQFPCASICGAVIRLFPSLASRLSAIFSRRLH